MVVRKCANLSFSVLTWLLHKCVEFRKNRQRSPNVKVHFGGICSQIWRCILRPFKLKGKKGQFLGKVESHGASFGLERRELGAR